ncbi:MAG: ABC transporter ATP-binding protein [Candidatus Omnitrophota bacterium]
MNTIIDVNRLSKLYKKNLRTIHALKNLDFCVQPNEILGILGPNGAGKTTLLKLMTGIARPDKGAGRIRVFGTENLTAIQHRIGFLPENPEFFKNLSADELLDFAMKASRTAATPDRIDQTLKRVHLFQERHEKVKHFSKGMRQRIGIAQAIIHDPELLILDEPMSGLDPQGRRMVIDVIKDYHAQGKTILFSTHDLDDIEALCTEVMVLVKGEIRMRKTLSELREKSSYHVEAENHGRKFRHTVDGPQLWECLGEIRENGLRLVRVQSGIAEHLEQYYKGETNEPV